VAFLSYFANAVGSLCDGIDSYQTCGKHVGVVARRLLQRADNHCNERIVGPHDAIIAAMAFPAVFVDGIGGLYLHRPERLRANEPREVVRHGIGMRPIHASFVLGLLIACKRQSALSA
jgi:hypothetical protein